MLKLADRVKESSTSNFSGTGSYTLAGATGAFQTFVAGIGNGNSCTYIATDGTNWEINEGVVTDSAPDTLSRATFIASSTGSAINWLNVTLDIFSVAPAERRGWVPLQRTVIGSAVGSVDFTGLTSLYSRYRLVFNRLQPATNDQPLYLRVSQAASFLSAGNYYGVVCDANSAGTTVSAAAIAVDSKFPISGNSINSNHGFSGWAEVEDIADATQRKQVRFFVTSVSSGGAKNLRTGFGFYDNNTAIDGLRLLAASGNLQAGVVELWGDRFT